MFNESLKMMLGDVAFVQSQGRVAAWVGEIDLQQARAEGVDCSKLLVSQPDDGEQARDVTEALIRSGQIGLVVITADLLYRDADLTVQGRVYMTQRFMARLLRLSRVSNTVWAV